MTILDGSTSTTDIADRVLPALAALGLPATPHTFEVWYTHLSGTDAALSAVIVAKLKSGEKLTPQTMEALYDAHITDGRTLRQAERSSRAIMMEIDGIVELVRMSLGSTSSYNKALSALLVDMVATSDPAALKDIVTTLVHATEETRGVNISLEKRLNAARSEVDDLRRVLEDTRLETLKDALTGISNRKHFEQTLNSCIESSAYDRQSFALLMIDIDHFKSFNDAHGHLTGDKVLRVVAHAMRDKFPGRATVSRVGGEEFAVILPEADMMAGWVGAEAARQSVQARELVKRSTGEKIGRITVSIGVGAWRRGDTAVSLVSRADAALMRAKTFGRNCTVTEDQFSKNAVA